MNQKLKAQWVKALRSGEYQQLQPGRSSWTKHGRHCCLGVLAELKELDTSPTSDLRSKFVSFGIPRDALDLLVRMNDGNEFDNTRRHSFAEIADYIEKNL